MTERGSVSTGTAFWKRWSGSSEPSVTSVVKWGESELSVETRLGEFGSRREHFNHRKKGTPRPRTPFRRSRRETSHDSLALVPSRPRFARGRSLSFLDSLDEKTSPNQYAAILRVSTSSAS